MARERRRRRERASGAEVQITQPANPETTQEAALSPAPPPTYGLTRAEILELLSRCPAEFTSAEVMRIWLALTSRSVTEDEVRARCPEVMAEVAVLQQGMAEMASAAGRLLKESVAHASAALESVADGARASGERMRQQLTVAATTLLGPPAEVRLLQAVRDQTTRQAEILIESAQQIEFLAKSGTAALEGLRTLEGLAGATVRAIEDGSESADRATRQLTKLTWALVFLTAFLTVLTVVLVALAIQVAQGAHH